jgi:hypothetical protein
MKAISQRSTYYTTILISPSGIIKILGLPPFTEKQVGENHKKYKEMIEKYGPIKSVETINNSSIPWTQEHINEASNVENGLNFVDDIVVSDTAVWKIMTAKFIVTEIQSSTHGITAYFSSTKFGAKEARLSIGLWSKCIGPGKLMEYYSNRGLILFS